MYSQISYAMKSRLWTVVKSGNNLYTVSSEEQYKSVLAAIGEMLELFE